nr:hypothetical protein [Tanacetum cinerariifolium]
MTISSMAFTILTILQAIEATDDSPAVLEHTTVETPMNMSPENKAHCLAEKEAIHLILTGIGDDIYSTVDAFQTTREMCEAIERLQQAKNANPLALVATAQASQDPYYQTPSSHRSSAPSPKPSIPSRSHTTTRHKGKEIAKPITSPSETASEEDSDPKQAQRDKDMQKKLALIGKYFKKIYKPTNNNLKISSNSKKKNVDMNPRYKNDDYSGQFGTQRTVNVAGPRENVGKCRKPKKVKDSAYHKEKMLLCKQAEQGVPLQAKQYDWLADTDEKADEQELEAHYSYMAKIQERTVNVAAARENVGSKVVQQSGIQCFNCREFGHFVKKCRKPKGLRTPQQYDWLADKDEEVDEQELEAHYNYMAKIQEVPTADSGTYLEPVE